MRPLNPPLDDWTSQRIWLIGASSGIGAASAAAFVARGARVALSARSADKLEALAARSPDRALAVPVDVTDARSLAAGHERIVGAWGGVDTAVFMAGTYAPVRAWELTSARAHEVVATNLTGVLDGLALVLPAMLARGSGRIVLVASVAGYRGLPRSLLYGPTKAALINLAESLYLDCAPKGVAVHLMCPGFVRTPLTAQNDFTMPNLIEPEQAAAEIAAGLERGEFETHFPKAFTRRLKFLRWWPDRAYFAAIRRATGV